MKVRVDQDKCQGHGMCAALVPAVFAMNEESGFNEMGEFEVSDVLRSQVLRGVSGCPEQAISVIGEETA